MGCCCIPNKTNGHIIIYNINQKEKEKKTECYQDFNLSLTFIQLGIWIFNDVLECVIKNQK